MCNFRYVLALLITAAGVPFPMAARAAESSPCFVYCSVAKDKSLVVLRLNRETGAVLKQSAISTPGEPSALVTSPDGRTLFAAMRSTGQLASYRIAPETGALTPINVVEAGADPAQLYVDPMGRYLLAAYYVAAKASVHRIGTDGSLSAMPHQEFPTVEKAHAIGLDPTHRWAYVPHTGPNVIFQFAWDADVGRLSPLDPLKVQRPPQTGPRHLAWHPKLPVVYIDNEQGSSVTAYRPGRDGALTAGATVSTLPPDFKANNATAEIKVHPNGRTVYVSNRGHDSLAVIRLDDHGTPTQLVAAEPTEKTPRSFDLTPDGQFLLAAGEATGRLVVYRISHDTGRLTAINTTEIGPVLWWVHVRR